MKTPNPAPQSQEDRFEQRLRRIVSDGTDQRLAPPRSAPPFDPGVDEPAHPQRRWLVAVVAAACALILAAGALVATNVLRPTQTVPANPAPTPTLTQLGQARIALPEGWTATPDQTYNGDKSWCLSPRVRPTPTNDEAECPLQLISVGTPKDIASDNIGGFPNNGVPCSGRVDDGIDLNRQVESRTFGGRRAEWRRWDFTCISDGRHVTWEQYVVKQEPAWIVYTVDAASPEIGRALTSLARNSQLPG